MVVVAVYYNPQVVFKEVFNYSAVGPGAEPLPKGWALHCGTVNN